MNDAFQQIAFTPSVLRAQEQYNGRATILPTDAVPTYLSDEEIGFIQQRDSFYLATVSETGWPYIQHRGGPRGFLRVLDPQTLAFADFHGNRQLLSVGNLAVHDRVALFLMDYNRRERLKILGHAKVLDARANLDLTKQLTAPGYPGKIERVFKIRVVATDWNCPQHISPRSD